MIDDADAPATPDAKPASPQPPIAKAKKRRRRKKVVQGPTFRKEQMVQPTTADERLLASRGDVGWLHADPWRVMRIQAEFVEGFGQLAEIGPAVSVFGSARTPKNHPMYADAVKIGAELVRRGYAVITGGGPGIMEAANRGANKAGGTSIGLGIELPFEASMNSYVNLGINFRYFFARKVMFLKYAQGFIVMPGGYGTFDELFESLTLAQTHKVSSFPVVLFGRSYWQGLADWLRDQSLDQGYISPDDLDMFLITDDIDEAIDHVTGGHGADQRGRHQ